MFYLKVNIVMFLLPGLLMTLCYSLIVAKLYCSAGSVDLTSQHLKGRLKERLFNTCTPLLEIGKDDPIKAQCVKTRPKASNCLS